MEELKRWRQELHRIPEKGLQEYQTAQYLRHELENMGYKWDSLLETDTLVYIDQGKKDTIAFRSDIDGLPVQEDNQVNYISTHQGMMHACGHDGHMSALLGLAKKIKESSMTFSHNILLIFQPAEESPGGAKLLIEKGVLDIYHVKAIYGMHLMPFLDEGVIACKEGAMMAMCGELDVNIYGKSAHAGTPQQGIDSIVIASLAIQQYQTLVSRTITPFAPIVFHIGKITGGTVRNSVASLVSLQGTLRCYEEDIFQKILSRIDNIHQGLIQAYGCDITWSCPPMYPPVNNDQKLYLQLRNLVKDQFQELKEPLMLSEDFSYYQKEIPGLFFFVGTRCDEYQSELHTSTFNFHESVLEKVVNLYFQIIQQED